MRDSYTFAQREVFTLKIEGFQLLDAVSLDPKQGAHLGAVLCQYLPSTAWLTPTFVP